MKISLGPKNCLFPMPVVLLGANVVGKPNYMTVAWDGVMDFTLISIAIARARYTYVGIKENGTFSVNIPSVDMLAETDYCGIVSGKNIDKGALFQNFYGKLGNAPLIAQCPINMECRLVRVVADFPTHDVIVGEIIETHCDDTYQTNGEIDWSKVRPILFTGTDGGYWKLGEYLGKMGKVGKEIKMK